MCLCVVKDIFHSSANVIQMTSGYINKHFKHIFFAQFPHKRMELVAKHDNIKEILAFALEVLKVIQNGFVMLDSFTTIIMLQLCFNLTVFLRVCETKEN